MNGSKRPFEILYEDNHLLAVLKPPGMLTQSDKSGDEDLLTFCREYVRLNEQKPGKVYLAMVHRLDRNVGGPIIFAKTSKAASRLSEQFRKNETKKIYQAVVEGIPDLLSGECIDWMIKKSRQRIAKPAGPETEGGQLAKLEYQVLRSARISKRLFNNLLFPSPGDENYDDTGNVNHPIALLRIKLLTGRFHQIRFQLSRMGFPILGDFKYRSGFRLREKSLALEAVELQVIHPTKNETISFCGPHRLEEVFINLSGAKQL